MGVGCSAGQMLCCLRLLAKSGELTVNGLEVSQKIPKGKMIQECYMMTLLSFKYGVESFVLWLRWGGKVSPVDLPVQGGRDKPLLQGY